MRGPNIKNPAVAPTTNGVQVGGSDVHPKPRPSTAKLSVKPNIEVRLSDGAFVRFQGREAQTLSLLIRKGAAGLTSGEASGYRWARRTSAYVRKLRLAGVPILTVRERVADARIGRYFLAGPVSVVTQGAEQ